MKERKTNKMTNVQDSHHGAVSQNRHKSLLLRHPIETCYRINTPSYGMSTNLDLHEGFEKLDLGGDLDTSLAV